MTAPFMAWVGFGDRGLIHLHRLETEREAHLERIRRLAGENQSLMAEIQRLRTDIQYVEKVARKELGLIKENEVIYRFAGDTDRTAAEPDRASVSQEHRRIEPTTGR